jgi:hypothetical protein
MIFPALIRSYCVKALLCGIAALLVAVPAAAQVGHDPATSPYADLEYKQELTLLGGYLRTRHDPAGVAPKSGPMAGIRYELSLVGPLALTSDVVAGFTSRDVIDPTQRAANRLVGTQNTTVYAADLGLAMNLTGRKSWHLLVPQLRAGLGVVHSSAQDTESGFSFGTPFAFSFGGGLKLVPGGHVQFRADITDRVFKLSYPDAFYRPASDNTAVLDAQTARSFYTHHAALTVGVSYLFSR